MPDSKSKADQSAIAKTLLSCVEETLTSMGGLTFSNTPEFKERNIIEYDSKMQVSGLEKFNDSAYVAAVNFYLSEDHQKRRECCGVLAAFIEEDGASKFLKTLGYTGFNDDDDELIIEKCAEFSTVLAEKFKEAMVKSGSKNFILSASVKGKNNIPGGIDFPYNQYVYYEANFYFWKKKSLVIDIVMDAV